MKWWLLSWERRKWGASEGSEVSVLQDETDPLHNSLKTTNTELKMANILIAHGCNLY